jgi:hypothetical protein
MKKIIFLLAVVSFISLSVNAQYRKNGLPDMRYSSNKQTTVIACSALPNFNTNTSVRYQSGYVKSNGTYVQPHFKTNNNSTNWDNFSTKSNVNSFTGTVGTRARDYSRDALNYGQGRSIYTGSRGGQYYYNNGGNKIYVPKR